MTTHHPITFTLPPEIAPLVHSIDTSPERNALVLNLHDGTERTVDAEALRENPERAIHDAFLCSKCDAPVAVTLLGRLVGADGRSRCERCARKEQHEMYANDVISRSAPEPVFDADIRVGDLVEVVSIDHEAVNEVLTNQPCHASWLAKVGERMIVGTLSCESPIGCREHYVTNLSEEGTGRHRWCHGRFRILERDGKVYVREKARGASTRRVESVCNLVTGEVTIAADSKLDALGCQWEIERNAGESDAAYRSRLEAKIRGCYEPGPPTAFDRSVERLRQRIRSLPGPPVFKPPDLPRMPSFAFEGPEFTDAVSEKRDTLPAPAPNATETCAPCAWCGLAFAGDDPCETSDGDNWVHSAGCGAYYSVLRERLATGGAYDTPEERESVRRFVDWNLPAARRCECGATADPRSFTPECADCAATACRIPEAPEREQEHPWSAGSTATWEWP